MGLRALLFDVDGTLADTEDAHRLAFNAAFREAGLEWDWSVSLYRDLLKVTGGKERIRYFVELYEPALASETERLDRLVAGLHQAKTRHYTEAVSRGEVGLRPGVLRLLEEARGQGLVLAIATTTSMENVEALLSSAIGEGAAYLFSEIGAGDVVGAKKPAPDIYQRVLERLALTPDECVALEDSDNGLRSALAAGIRAVVITTNDYTHGQDFEGASLVVDQLGDPGSPCNVYAGPALAEGFVAVDDLRRLNEARRRGREKR